MPTISQSFAAMTGLIAAIALWASFEVWLGNRTRRAPLLGRARSSELLMAASTVVAIVTALVTSSVAPRLVVQPYNLAFALGMTLLVAGVSVRVAATRQLGAFYTLDVGTQAAQHIVTRGLYRWVRHPGYSGTIVALLGIAFALGSWASVVSLLVIIPALAARIRAEERVLTDVFGQAYSDYRAATRWRLLPGVI